MTTCHPFSFNYSELEEESVLYQESTRVGFNTVITTKCEVHRHGPVDYALKSSDKVETSALWRRISGSGNNSNFSCSP